ncbi:MAG: hypothetical protein LC117_10420 [Bacteroidia bacterium]|nr:hypothetical protein [Bacteroidia bacterium]
MEFDLQPSEEYLKANELIKQSTSLKKTDILKAIELIKEAIKIYPSDESLFKLANYHFDAGKVQDSYDLLNGQLQKYSFSGFANMKNMNRYKVYEKIAVINFKDKKYKDYITNSSMQFFNWLVGLALQGRKEEVIGLITRQPFEMYFVETKMDKSFKELNIADKQKEFYTKLQSLFSNLKPNLLELCNIYEQTNFRSHGIMRIGESTGDYEDKILNKNPNFVNTYNSLDEQIVFDLCKHEINAP